MDVHPKLPHDVLLNVASFADRKSILALLTTTRSLHCDCGKYVLQDLVKLGGDLDIVSFLYFMRPHKHKRWRHLRSLRLRDKPISPRIAAALAKVIPRASHLKSLEFEHAENILGAHPNLPLAFAALRTVHDIVIDHGYQHTCTMLEAMHWPLESAELKHSDHESYPDNLHRIHPAALLRNSRATLKTLECQLWSDFDDVLATYPIYPQLESLHVEGVWCGSVAHWAISYPNVKRLSVNTINGQDIDAGADQLERHSAIRLRNLEEHMAQDQQWIGLEAFVGHSILDVYVLGLPCRIRDVTLTLSPALLPCFALAMETARPTVLTLSLTSELFSQPVPTYLEDPALANVKNLGLAVTVWVGGTDGDTGEIDVDRFLGHVLRMLQRVSAKAFAFFVEVHRLDDGLLPCSSSDIDDPDEQGERPMPPPAPPRALSRVETWVNNADLDAVVRRFQDEVPSLEWVKLSFEASSISCWKDAESSRGRVQDGQLNDTPILTP